MTILGYHTAAELADLVAAFDSQVKSLSDARDAAASSSSWSSVDPQGWASWLADFATFENAYDASASKAHAIANSETGVGSDVAYGDLLRTFQNGNQPSPGGFDDLNRRFMSSPAAATNAPVYNVPQPTAPDSDLNFINNPGVKAAANAGQAVANAGAAAGKAVGGALSFFASHPILVGAGVVVAGGSLLLLALGGARRAAPLAL